MADEEDKKDEQKEDKAEVTQETPAEDTKADKTETPADKPTKSKDEPKAEVPEKFKKLVDQLESLSVLELSELVKVLEDHFGVSAAAPMAVAAAPAGGGDSGDSGGEEKTEFTVVLKDAGAQKVAVIKAVKDLTGLGLGESKAIVDGVPKPVKEGVPKDEAEEAKTKLEEAGATVELQ